MIRFWCECGRQLQADDAQVGAPARCPVCLKVTVVPVPSPAVDDKQQSAPPARPAWGNANLLSLPHAGNPFAFCYGVGRCHDAEASLAFGVFGLFTFGLVSPLAIVLGVVALRQLRGCEEERPGKWEALVGLTLGIVQATGVVVVILLLTLSSLLR